MNTIEREYHDNDSGYKDYKLHSFFCQIIRAFRLISLAFMYMVLVFAYGQGLHFKRSDFAHLVTPSRGFAINNFYDLTWMLQENSAFRLFSFSTPSELLHIRLGKHPSM